MPHTYFRSSLCVSLCLAKADALPNTLLQTYMWCDNQNEKFIHWYKQELIESQRHIMMLLIKREVHISK